MLFLQIWLLLIYVVSYVNFDSDGWNYAVRFSDVDEHDWVLDGGLGDSFDDVHKQACEYVTDEWNTVVWCNAKIIVCQDGEEIEL